MMSERQAWLLLVTATTMRADASSYHDPMEAMRQACTDRAKAIEVLTGLGFGLVAHLPDPYGLWAGAEKWVKKP